MDRFAYENAKVIYENAKKDYVCTSLKYDVRGVSYWYTYQIHRWKLIDVADLKRIFSDIAPDFNDEIDKTDQINKIYKVCKAGLNKKK